MRPIAILFSAVPLLAISVACAPHSVTEAASPSLVGHYEGTAKWADGQAKLVADLRLVDGKVAGTLDSGEGPIAITSAALADEQVLLTLDMNGSPGRVTGRAAGGVIEGEWVLGGMSGTLQLTRTGDPHAPNSPQVPAQKEAFATHAKLQVVVPDFPAEGLILDVGGGGEGVIGQLKGRQVVAIDLSKRELDEAPGEPLLKIVMDARDLKFSDASFSTATVFFTFMYIDQVDHEKVLRELNRVLRPGGRVLVWDPVFPARHEPAQASILYPLHITLPSKAINTGYGVPFRDGQGADHFAGLAGKTGFEIVSRRDEAGWFFLELGKVQREGP